MGQTPLNRALLVVGSERDVATAMALKTATALNTTGSAVTMIKTEVVGASSGFGEFGDAGKI